MQLFELYREGGFVMHPLLACLILSLAIAIEKFITVSKLRKDSAKIKKAFIEGNELTQFNECISRPYQQINEYKKLGKEEVKSNSERHSNVISKQLHKSTWMVGTVASSAPFIGLIGTVIGIIKSFGSISRAGKGGFAIVAADLSEALVATAAGIIVAVIALILFNFIKQKIKETMDEYNFDLEDTIEKSFLKTRDV